MRKSLVVLLLAILYCCLNGQNFISHASIHQDFCDSSVLVSLDSSRSRVNMSHDISMFENIDIIYLNDLTSIEGDTRNMRLNEESFMQILLLRLADASKENVLDTIEKLRFTDGVYFAEPNYFSRLNVVPNNPNDPDLGLLWGMTKIQAPEAWSITTGLASVRIGIMDSGVVSHPDLNANVVHHINFEPKCPIIESNHGTHVAGTVGAVGNNGIGVVGVNWTVSMYDMKISFEDGPDTVASHSTMIEAITWAIQQDIPILNMSFGGFGTLTTVRNHIANNYTGLFVWSAGNATRNVDIDVAINGSFDIPNLISVGSTDNLDQRSNFSNYGIISVNIYAPGSLIRSTVFNDGYAAMSGTSMAAPHVAGVAGLLLATDPTLTGSQLKSIIMESADPITIQTPLTPVGAQNVLRLNAYNALKRLPAPRNLVAVAGNEEVILTWEAPILDQEQLSGYKIFRNGIALPDIIDGLTFTDTELDNNTEYTYFVTAVYSVPNSESPPSNIVTARTNALFNPPLPLPPVVVGNSVTLNWEAAENPMDSYTFAPGIFRHHTWESPTSLTQIPTNNSPFEFGIRFSSDQLIEKQVAGGMLTNVRFATRQGDAVYTIRIFTGGSGTTLDPGTQIGSPISNISNPGIEASFVNVNLSPAVQIPFDEELWITIHTTGESNPALTDPGPALAGYGDLFKNNIVWSLLSNSISNRNWVIEATASTPTNGTSVEFGSSSRILPSLIGYNVWQDDIFITSLPNDELTYTIDNAPTGTHTYYVYAVYNTGISNRLSFEVTVEEIPMSVILSSFTATVVSMSPSTNVNLEWITNSESNMMGYHVFRGASSEVSQGYIDDAIRITRDMIPARNTSTIQTYSFISTDNIYNVSEGAIFEYWLQMIYNDRTSRFHGPITVNIKSETTQIDVPLYTMINNVFPNPVTNIAHFGVQVKEGETAVLRIFNVRGQLVKEFETLRSGVHNFTWDSRDNQGREVSTGVYFYRLTSDTVDSVRRMVIIK